MPEPNSTWVLCRRYAGQGKSTITALNCLVHNAGYPPDPNPEYWSQDVRQQRRSVALSWAVRADVGAG